jgi:hypothetical protein
MCRVNWVLRVLVQLRSESRLADHNLNLLEYDPKAAGWCGRTWRKVSQTLMINLRFVPSA